MGKQIKVAIIGMPFICGIGNINKLIQPFEEPKVIISRQQRRKIERDKK